MDLASILFVVIVFLTATAICVVLFQRLGLGSILGFIVAGVIIGPHTPGPVPLHAVDELQSVAEFGVVLFMFAVGLEMRPEKVWAMRRLIFGLGSAQMAVTAFLVSAYLLLSTHLAWESAAIIGLAFAMSSTAIVMATLAERGEQATEHGRTGFAVLMAQDIWIVPVMALVPILAHTAGHTTGIPLWEKLLRTFGTIGAILVVGRYLLPAALGYCAARRQLDAFRLILFLAVISAAWAVDQVGISMTLGAFVLGMMLSASDLRYQIDASVDLFKQTLMGLFFIAVGMSIDVSAVLVDWRALLMHVPIILLIKVSTLIALALAFGASREAAVFVTSQETDRAKKLAITLHSLYPNLDVYVRVDTIAEQDELTAKGISHAGTGYIESTLTRGAALLQDLGLSQDDLNGLLEALRRDNYAMIRSSFKQLPAK